MHSLGRRLFVGLIVLAICFIIVILVHTGMMTTVTVLSTEQYRQLCDSTRQSQSGKRRLEDAKLNRHSEYATERRCEEEKKGKPKEESDEEKVALQGRRERGGTEKQVANEREADDREEERVVSRIETCLRTTNTSGYLEEEGYLSDAYNNARHMIRTLRTLIPRTFSSDYLSPCWEADFEGSVQRKEKIMKFIIDGTEIATSFSTVGFQTWQKKVFLSHNKGHFSSPLVCLPKFFIAGFPKCGTSYLYCLMGQRFGGGSNVAAPLKEPHWWVKSDMRFMNRPTVEYIPPYLLNFIDASIELASGHYRSKYQQPLTIDGSPNVIFGWPQWNRRQAEFTNYCLLPAVIPEVLPDSKYVVVMRNPVDRLYSAFWFSCHTDKRATLQLQNGNHGPDVFHERISVKVKQFVICSRTYPLAACMNGLYHHSVCDSPSCGEASLEMSLYFFHIQKWLSIVPREKFVFLTSEELSQSDLVEMKVSILLSSAYFPDITLRTEDISACKSNTHSQSVYHDHHDLQMIDDTREMLTEFFKPYNGMLADLLGDKRFLWES